MDLSKGCMFPSLKSPQRLQIGPLRSKSMSAVWLDHLESSVFESPRKEGLDSNPPLFSYLRLLSDARLLLSSEAPSRGSQQTSQGLSNLLRDILFRFKVSIVFIRYSKRLVTVPKM